MAKKEDRTVGELEDALRKAEYDAAEAQRDNARLRARNRELTEELNKWGPTS